MSDSTQEFQPRVHSVPVRQTDAHSSFHIFPSAHFSVTCFLGPSGLYVRPPPQPHLFSYFICNDTNFPKFLQRHRATSAAVFPHRYLWDDISRPFSISVINKFHWWLPICCRQRSVCGVELCTPAATHQNNKNLHLDPPSRHHAKLLMHRGSHRIIYTLPK